MSINIENLISAEDTGEINGTLKIDNNDILITIKSEEIIKDVNKTIPLIKNIIIVLKEKIKNTILTTKIKTEKFKPLKLELFHIEFSEKNIIFFFATENYFFTCITNYFGKIQSIIKG